MVTKSVLKTKFVCSACSVTEQQCKRLRTVADPFLCRSSSVGLYGFDLYSLHSSMEAVVEYLEKADPTAAKKVK